MSLGDTEQNKNRDLAVMLGLLLDESPEDQMTELIKKMVLRQVEKGCRGDSEIYGDTCGHIYLSPFFIAIKYGWVDILSKFIENGFDVNMTAPETGITPLYHAIKEHKPKCVELLLKSGAEPNIYQEHYSVFYCPTACPLSMVIYTIQYDGIDVDKGFTMLNLMIDYCAEFNPEELTEGRTFSSGDEAKVFIDNCVKYRLGTVAIGLFGLNLPLLIVYEIICASISKKLLPNMATCWEIFREVKSYEEEE